MRAQVLRTLGVMGGGRKHFVGPNPGAVLNFLMEFLYGHARTPLKASYASLAFQRTRPVTTVLCRESVRWWPSYQKFSNPKILSCRKHAHLNRACHRRILLHLTTRSKRGNASRLSVSGQESGCSDRDGHWHPHLMFFVPLTDPASWAAGLPGSPVVVAFTDTPERHTVFLIPVAKWSDGTPAPVDEQ
jgi:hypothetical protein